MMQSSWHFLISVFLKKWRRALLLFDPFTHENLSTSSYDVTLGEYFFIEQQPHHFQNVYNIYDKKHTEDVWGTTPLRAETAEKVFEKHKFEFTGIGKKDKVILLAPGETILAHTNEFIGGQHHITTMMKARSSLGRNFIEVCKCAGWGDVGYINRWTMEITNNSQHYFIPLVVGRRVAQIIFFDTGPIMNTKKDYAHSGKYQSRLSLAELKKKWRPEMMVPKMYKDREIRD